MKIRGKGLILAAVHLAMVLGLGGKLLVDRATRPRYWLKAAPVDPNLPIRGRYVSLRVEVPIRGAEMPPPISAVAAARQPWFQASQYSLRLSLNSTPEGLIATKVPPQPSHGLADSALGPEEWPGNVSGSLSESLRDRPSSQWVVQLEEPLAFFIPEQVPDPSRRAAGEELWVEVTLPKKGPLRPIRLAVKKDGKLTPLEL